MRRFYVYMMTNRSRTLYIGVTNDLERRVREHREKRVPGFTARYNLDILVLYQEFTDVVEAIASEKRLKGWTRAKKIALIEDSNPHWEDLARAWQVVDQAPAITLRYSEGSGRG
jgi:putative endonuclease